MEYITLEQSKAFSDKFNNTLANIGNSNSLVNTHTGDSSIGYSKNFNQNVVGIIGEIPYVYDKKIEDTNLTKRTRRENIIDEIARLEKLDIR